MHDVPGRTLVLQMKNKGGGEGKWQRFEQGQLTSAYCIVTDRIQTTIFVGFEVTEYIFLGVEFTEYIFVGLEGAGYYICGG
jgi:hypothetical protein